jgi:vacuolar-type H+-ATPase subunit E/Vma4
MTQKQNITSVSPQTNDSFFPIWRLERQVAEQLRRGVKTIDGSTVAVSIGSSTFTYVRKIGNELVVKYVEGCVVVTASAKLAEGEEVKVYDVSVHNICSRVDI